MTIIPKETYHHHSPLDSTANAHHTMHQLYSNSEPSSVFTNDSSYNTFNSTGPVGRNIEIQLEEDEIEKESEMKIEGSESVNEENVNKDIESQSSESNELSLKETLLSVSQPTLGQGRKALLLDLWALNEISLQIRNWLVYSAFDVTDIIGSHQKGVSCGYIAAQAACICRKLFTKDIEDEPLRPLIMSKCLDPDLVKTANDVLEIDDTEAASLDMVQIYEVILSLMGGSDDLSWLTVTTWNAFMEGMKEGHQSNEFSVWIVNTADTESSMQEGYDDRADHWFTVVLWP